jgi:hypothetical protein
MEETVFITVSRSTLDRRDRANIPLAVVDP